MIDAAKIALVTKLLKNEFNHQSFGHFSSVAIMDTDRVGGDDIVLILNRRDLSSDELEWVSVFNTKFGATLSVSGARHEYCLQLRINPDGWNGKLSENIQTKIWK